MSNLNTIGRLLGAVGAGLALCAVALPAAAQEAQAMQEAAAPTADAQTVSRDATTGQLRAATPQEQAALQTMKANKQARVAATPALQKFHRSGASGFRVNDAFLSSVTAVRTPDGKLQMIESQGGAAAVAQTPTATNTPVTE